jgi:protein-L-isoaspartate(D-aspartate) O-methyltransferase
MTDFAVARLHMVDCQLLPNNVTDDRLIAAMADLPREIFMPKSLRGVAYVDEDLVVASGRFLVEPMVFARMVQACAVKETDAVLDVGCATGYSTAVLARLANVVVALEEDDDIVTRASANLAKTDIGNVAVIAGRLRDGYPRQAPYDVIVLEGAVPEAPTTLLDQLGEGGRLVCVVLDGGVGKIMLFTKVTGVIGRRELFDGNTPLLPGFELEVGFAF